MILLNRYLPNCPRGQLLLKMIIIYIFYRIFIACLNYKFEITMTSNDSTLALNDGRIWTHNFSYLFTPKLFNCRRNLSDLSPIIVIVTSKPDHFSLRSAIRRTWATIFNRSSIGVVFVLGHNGSNIDRTTALNRESDLYGDLLVADFEDTYYNLSLKTFLALKWVHSLINGRCVSTNGSAGIRFILKTDDDVFIYASNVLRFIDRRKGATMEAYCHRFDNALVNRDFTNPRRYISYSLYRQRYYPSFCSGHAYILTADGLKPLLDYVQRYHGYVYLEDVFFTGLASDAVGIKRIHDHRFQWWEYNRMWYFTDLSNAFSVHYVTTDKLMEKFFANQL